MRQGRGQGTHKGRPYGVGGGTPGLPRAGERRGDGRNMLRPYGLASTYPSQEGPGARHGGSQRGNGLVNHVEDGPPWVVAPRIPRLRRAVVPGGARYRQARPHVAQT